MIRTIAVINLFILICSSKLPPKNNGALMARCIVHKSDYTSIASLSTIENVKGHPFVTVTSISDGPPTNGTGNTYMYLPAIDLTAHDVAEDNRVSLVMSLIESDYCNENNLDPEDPNCCRVTLFGRLVKVDNTDEYNFAKKTLFDRHPIMASWPKSHGFFFAKVNFEQIVVLDQFGGPLFVTVKDYFNVNTTELSYYSNKASILRRSYNVFRVK